MFGGSLELTVDRGRGSWVVPRCDKAFMCIVLPFLLIFAVVMIRRGLDVKDWDWSIGERTEQDCSDTEISMLRVTWKAAAHGPSRTMSA